MRFSRLRLLGFKSFVEPTEFVIEQGLTGVVGPNGCGKSNLVEALRWVMGENSYKNMRASGMDDVIFSGSGTRPSRNTAEVTLFLQNHDRTAPAAFNDSEELIVSRRIEREAGSAYRINGKEARAKDVQLLFADQSTGARSPSMVGQGRIGELIQAKPQARRALLEEAAGISGLHSRRHEAELRLRAAEQNLERLDDVTSELESQIESLKRQARQASRFKTLSADIRATEATLFHLRWTQAKTQEGEADSALNVATNLVAERAQAQMAAAKDQGVSAHHLPQLRETEAKAAAALQRLTIARAQIEEEAERLRNRKAELEKRLAQLTADIAREEQLLSDNAGILTGLMEEETRLAAEDASAGEIAQGIADAHAAADASLKDSEQALSRITAERAEAQALRSQLERTAREAGERRTRLDGQLQGILREAEEIGVKIAALADPAGKLRDVEDADRALAAAEADVISAERGVEEARRAEVETRKPVEAARTELNRIETEARTLAKMLNAASPGLFPAVVDEIKVDKGFETALGAALGDDMEAPVDRSAPAHWGDAAFVSDTAALPDGVTPLSAHVRAPRQLQRRLSQIGLIETSDALRLQPLLAPGQRLVSKDGALWRWDGFVASADAPSAAALRLAQKNRLAELDAEALLATAKLREVEAREAEAKRLLAQIIDAERTRRETLRSAQRKVGEARDAHAAAERAAGHLSSRRAVLDDARNRLSADIAETSEALARSESALLAAPDLTEVSARLTEISTEVAHGRAQLAEARARHEGLKREAEVRTRRLAAIDGERKAWMARGENAHAQIAALNDRREEATRELALLADGPDEIDSRRSALMSELANAEAARKQAADLLQAAENRQQELDRAATLAIQTLSESREGRARAEERLVAARDRRTEIEGRIREVAQVEPHEVFKLTGLGQGDPLPQADQTERNLDRLKIERERLGAVNLRAEEEQSELSTRLEILVSEREDVVEAIKTLRQAIQGLNREGRERLLGAFDVVNGHFQRLFTHLFGGGTADLQLIESEDPLEAGLEILARPPGKKPQTMTLLSGGEQALTAMALIFAVFLTNPAPICVLDEVDAPLDDHNVERFCNLMDEMARSTETRFVIITHNPITMARMNRLFGVTMAEQGVSQLVSVDLEMAEQIREAG
ncbi:MAG: chromosome segregation protein SMC [Rhizobiaceae bacterium]